MDVFAVTDVHYCLQPQVHCNCRCIATAGTLPRQQASIPARISFCQQVNNRNGEIDAERCMATVCHYMLSRAVVVTACLHTCTSLAPCTHLCAPAIYEQAENFSFPFVVAACTLVTCFAAARPILGVGKVRLLLPGLFVGVRLKFVWIGAFEVGVLARMLVGFVGLDRRVSLVSLILLSSLSVVALSTAALRVIAPFV